MHPGSGVNISYSLFQPELLLRKKSRKASLAGTIIKSLVASPSFTVGNDAETRENFFCRHSTMDYHLVSIMTFFWAMLLVQGRSLNTQSFSVVSSFISRYVPEEQCRQKMTTKFLITVSLLLEAFKDTFTQPVLIHRYIFINN